MLGARANSPDAQHLCASLLLQPGRGYAAVTGALRENTLARRDGMLTLNR